MLLEVEWVLRGVYRFEARQILAALTGFVGLPRVQVEDLALTARALRAMAAGMDFADALHAGNTPGCEAFVSFDRRLVRALDKLGWAPARVP